MEFEKKSSGVAKAGLTTGIIGTVLGTMGVLGAGANGLSGLLGGTQTQTVTPAVMPYTIPMTMPMVYSAPVATTVQPTCCCNEDHVVDRYEASLQAAIAEKDTQIALRDANTYNDQKNLEMYKYVDGRFREFEQAFAAQAVNNQKTADDVLRVQANLDCCCKELNNKICNESRERQCADNTIVTYANATFYSKLIADITAGTGTTAQQVYNPLPQSNGGCCNC